MATTSASQSAADDRAWVESVDRGEVEHQVGHDRARRTPRRSGRRRRRRSRRSTIPPSSRSTSVTTGLKCAPDTGPKARISARARRRWRSSSRAAAARRRRARAAGRRCPSPTTAATRKPVPSASAPVAGEVEPERRRSRSVGERLARVSAAARGRLGCRRAAHGVARRARRCAAGRRHLGVGEDGVDLPRLAVGGVDPHLVLHGRSNRRRRPRSRWRGRRRQPRRARRRPRRWTRPRRRGG